LDHRTEEMRRSLVDRIDRELALDDDGEDDA
jgi:hypothetical protein